MNHVQELSLHYHPICSSSTGCWGSFVSLPRVARSTLRIAEANFFQVIAEELTEERAGGVRVGRTTGRAP